MDEGPLWVWCPCPVGLSVEIPAVWVDWSWVEMPVHVMPRDLNVWKAVCELVIQVDWCASS